VAARLGLGQLGAVTTAAALVAAVVAVSGAALVATESVAVVVAEVASFDTCFDTEAACGTRSASTRAQVVAALTRIECVAFGKMSGYSGASRRPSC